MDPIDSWWVFPGFQIDHIATGLDKPVNVATVPRQGSGDSLPLLYVTELYGQVKVVTNDCQVRTYADGLLNYGPDNILPGTGESGVTGICVEPGTGDLFVSMLYLEDGSYRGKLVRMHSRDGLRMERMTTILDGIPSAREAHQIQAVTIGPDGKLYVNVADGYWTPEAAQNDNDLRGKVLRLNLDGSVPNDNPTKGSPVYAKGFRNPFGAAWRNSDRSLYITDNGHRTDDRIARVVPGGNYGWYPDMRKNSLLWWHFTQAPTALDFMQGGQFPEDFEDQLFVALAGPSRYRSPCVKGKTIIKMQLNEDGTGIRSYDHFVSYIGGAVAMPVGLQFGTDGLYFTDFHGESFPEEGKSVGNIFRVRPLDGGR